ncbi:Stk1 family PASTA domain-containing Ser/Thr kinase [[Eubacterium] hominis]|uniref:Stk1 family PASTA domain-containing Ser/Thr kinase n=1 Tax=[Eubacterium] hominis TaxID=2764325 RepID=UPI003A4D1D11
MNKMIGERYMLVTSLGEGGMADVYLAVDTILNREVAIKVLRGELGKDPVALLRFQREANAVSKLNHPNVVDVYDVGECEGRHYIVMEYVRGRTLKQLISQRGALNCDEAVNIMMQLTSAVQHAHENHIIHRDIKPQNVLVKDDGTVKITDFGIALAHDAVQLTQSNAVLGSAHYLAPETTRGETPTNQVDIYALGIVFYELLTGSVPFNGDNPVQIAMKHLREEVPSVKEFNPTIPQSVENIIIKATVKNRSLRYQSANDMLIDLDDCLLPEKRNVAKLVFQEESQPTLVMDAKKSSPTKKQNKAKSKVIPIEDEEEDRPEKSHTKLIIVILLGIICVAATIAILFFSGMLTSEKTIVVPDVQGVNQRDAQQTLKLSGFDASNIKIKEALSDDVEKGKVISISPEIGSDAKKGTSFTLTISKGIYFVVDDYTNQLYEDVKAQLEKENANLEVKVEYSYAVDKKAGYIIEQKGHVKGDKLDPDEKESITFVVTAKPTKVLENMIGRNVEEVQDELQKEGFVVVTSTLSTSELSEEELAEIKHNVVIQTDPKEGTKYTQEGEEYIMLYYYE